MTGGLAGPPGRAAPARQPTGQPVRTGEPVRTTVPLVGALAPISAAVRVGDMVHVSGTVAVDLATGQVRGRTVGAQARDIFDQIARTLARAGSGLPHVVRCGCYLTDAADLAAFNEVFAEVFPTQPPARTTVLAGLVLPGLLVEVEVTAYCPGPAPRTPL